MAQPRYTATLPDNQKIVYTDSRPETDLKTIIAVHGFRGTDEGLENVLMPIIEGQDYRVITFNIPGMGFSPIQQDAEYTLEAIVAKLIDFISVLDCPKPVILLGHSFGTTVAARACMQTPELFKKLILVSPIPHADGRSRNPLRRSVVKVLDGYFYLIEKSPEMIGRKIYANKTFSDFSTDILVKKPTEKHRIRELHRANLDLPVDRRAIRTAHRASTRHDVSEFAKFIYTPTVIIAGDSDDLARIKYIRRLANQFPVCELNLLNGAGHLAHHENTTELSMQIEEALA